VSVGVMQDGATFSSWSPTTRKDTKQGLTPSSIRILRLVNAYTKPSGIAALLHRDGLYSSYLTDPSRFAS